MKINLSRWWLPAALVVSIAALSSYSIHPMHPSSQPKNAGPGNPGDSKNPADPGKGAKSVNSVNGTIGTESAESANRVESLTKKRKPVVIGYVGGYNGRVISEQIDARKLTHINYAFVDIQDGRAFLRHEATDTANFRLLVGLKSQNPELKIMISIGGWSWSKFFSDAVLTDASRAVFASSAIDIVSKYKLDGVDIDWEYPDQIGDGNKFRPEDKQNYTLFFMKLREGLDSLGKINHEHYFTSTAVGADQRFLDHTEMGQAALYLDFINIMSYDFKEDNDSISGHHTNLYASKETQDPKQGSVDKAVHEFEAAGVPASKLVVGLGFYAHVWAMKTTDNHGLYRSATTPLRGGVFHDASDGGGGYSFIKDSLVNQNGYTRYWDKDAHAPWLFNEDQKIFLSYDDEQSVTDKCKYVEKNQLGGVMFWEYNSDKKGYLLSAIAQEFGMQ